MKKKFGVFVMIAAFVAIFSAAAHAQEGPIAGGYGDTDVNDAGVVAASKFAVRKQASKTSSTVTLVKILNAKVQVVAGLNYEVCVETTIRKRGSKAVKQFARVVVYRNLKNQYSLTSWTVLKDRNGC